MKDPTGTIPLLKFPLLVFEEVMREMSFSEKFSFSLCSKKSFRLVKSLRIQLPELAIYQDEFRDVMTIAIPSLPLISFRSIWNYEGQNILKRSQISGHTAEIDTRDSNHWIVCFYDIYAGMRVFMQYFYKLFEQNFQTIFVRPRLLEIMDVIKAKQDVPLKYGKILRDDLDATDIDIILHDFYSDCLEIEGGVPYGTHLYQTIPRPFKNLKFIRGEFVRLEDVLNFGQSCQEIEIVVSRMGVDDVNQLLRHWLDGRMRALRFFSIEFGAAPNIAWIHSAIRRHWKVFIEEKVYTGHQKTPKTFPAGRGLRRRDGTRASYHLDGKVFRFAVWSDN